MSDRRNPGVGPAPSRCRRALVVACAAALAWSAAACRPSERAAPPVAAADGELVLDLVEDLGVATVEVESRLLDLGAPSARPHLVAGWGFDEQDADGTYVWATGGEASLEFFAAAAAEVTLGLLCRPFVFEDAPEQTVRVAVGGERLTEIRLRPELERYRVEVPSRLIRGGHNRLDLAFGYHRRPRDVSPGIDDDRSLAARCYQIELEGLGAETAAGEVALPALASAGEDGAGAPDRIELPSGTAVSYYFEHSGASALVAGAVEAWGPDAADMRLTVRFVSADGAPETSRVIDPGVPGALRVPLASDGPAVDRLELAAVAEGRGRRGWLGRLLRRKTGASGLTLVLPAVRAAAAEPPAAESPSGAPASGAPASGARPNVVVYLIDTLRADHLGIYGYSRPTSPNIDRFAADGILFENALAQSSWTRPAVVSILTGLAPRRHGVNRRQDALAGSVDTLSELLAREGYATAGYVTNGNAGPNFGVDRGFESFRHLRESAEFRQRHRQSDHLNLWLFHWLENRGEDDRPFFLYAHATDPHVPYTPAPEFRRRFAPDADPELEVLENVRAVFEGRVEPTEAIRRDLIDLYDAEIAFNDHHFGQLIERLKEMGLYDSSLIVLVSDHGEEFLDHGGWEHGVTLYEEQLRVPLIVKLPGSRAAGDRPAGRDRHAGRRIAAIARQVDLVPTILGQLGVAPPPGLDGVDLLAPSPDARRRSSFAYLSLQDRLIRSITRGGWKLILDDSAFPRGLPLQLYALGADRREASELAAERPFERELLAQLMRRWELDLAQGARAAGEQVEIPEDLRRQLEALGYL